jgi:hypothetical protein
VLGQDLLRESALWHVDLGLSVSKPHINIPVNSLAVSCWVEDVANSITVLEWMVGDLTVLLVSAVGESDKEFSSGVSIEGVVNISLNLGLVPDLALASLGMDGGDLLVEVRVGVIVLPERLTVLGVISSTVVLLRTVVGEWNTTGGQGEGNGRFEFDILA